jgi:signal transduction histidine kinase
VEEVVRHRIAQELHDRVGAAMSTLGEQLDTLVRKLPSSDHEVQRRLHDSRSLLLETMDQLRKTVEDLRGPLLENHALPATLRWYAETIGRREGVNLTVQIHGTNFRLPDEKAVCLLRIAQETIARVVDHGTTRKAHLVLKRLGGRVRLAITVEGLDLAALEGATRALEELRQRVDAVGGRLKFDASPEEGTSITVDVTARR